MRVSVTMTQSPTLFAKVNAQLRGKIPAAKAATQHSAERAFARVQDAVPRDTHYMAEHTQIRFTDEGLGYKIGWYKEDFIGHENPVTEKVITTFYPYWVHHGARGKMGRDVLSPALQAERPNYRKAMQRAVNG